MLRAVRQIRRRRLPQTVSVAGPPGIEAEFWLNFQAHYNLIETRLARAENYQSIQPRRSFKAAA